MSANLLNYPKMMRLTFFQGLLTGLAISMLRSLINPENEMTLLWVLYHDFWAMLGVAIWTFLIRIGQR